MSTRALRSAGYAAPAFVVALGSASFALLSTRSPTRLSLDHAWAAPTAGYPLGSGDAGVDILALAVHATARALGMAAVVASFGFVVGTLLGATAGLRGGAAQRWLLRACDLTQSFPTFLLALAVLSAVSVPSRWHIGAVFCLTVWAPFARISAVQARVIAQAEFVQAARALGATRATVVGRHVVPNLLGPVAIQLGTAAAGIVLGEAALGFVGLGPPDGVSLGALLEQGTLSMLRAPHVLAVGAVTVATVSGSLQLASEGLRYFVSGAR
ncbi:MAG: ABC transporter permease [Polyangiaceae bacterium]|nr:ABC transporter permease [Polyangiaceae bacterium]